MLVDDDYDDDDGKVLVESQRRKLNTKDVNELVNKGKKKEFGGGGGRG